MDSLSCGFVPLVSGPSGLPLIGTLIWPCDFELLPTILGFRKIGYFCAQLTLAGSVGPRAAFVQIVYICVLFAGSLSPSTSYASFLTTLHLESTQLLPSYSFNSIRVLGRSSSTRSYAHLDQCFLGNVQVTCCYNLSGCTQISYP
eukprot:1168398-Amphidinium_carterae.1